LKEHKKTNNMAERRKDVYNESSITWEQGMSFSVSVNGFKLTLDAAPEFGGNETGQGPNPSC